MMRKGQLCRVALLYGEHLTAPWLHDMKVRLSKQGCDTQIVYLDDESGDDKLPPPFSYCPFA